MMPHAKLVFLLITLFMIPHVWSQGSLVGEVLDSASKKPLPFATATVFRSKDTSIVTYRLSDPGGKIKIPDLPIITSLYVIISYSGYEVYRRAFTLSNDPAQLNLNTVYMKPDTKALDEVLVIAERPPVRVYRDTIEFNAASFKTLPIALVEDLLKKFPGVQVDQSGNIIVNGKRVNRILVDGKFFFGNDPKMATRNLPANMIDKVQVMDDQQEMDRNSSGDLTDIGKVINLTLRKGIKKGWFGRLYGGYGTRDRYEAGGIANIYRDTLQLSVLGYSNNINRSGFTLQDITGIGGFERSGLQSLNIVRKNGNEGFSVNGISFGGLDEGVARSDGAGLNLNHAPNKKFNLFSQYFFGHTHNRIQTVKRTEQFIGDTTINTFTESILPRITKTHNANLGMNIHPTTYTSISLQASGIFTMQEGNALSTIQTANDKTGIVSTGAGVLGRDMNSQYFGNNLAITLKSKNTKGRILNLLQNFSYQDNNRKYTTASENIFFYPAPDTVLFNQLRKEQSPSKSLNAQVNLAEPLSKQWTLRFNNSYDFLKDDQDISLFDKDPLSGKYIFSMSTGGRLSREQNRFSSRLALAYTIKSMTLTLSANGLWQHVQNAFKQSGSAITYNTFDLLPGLSVFWKSWSLTYDKNVIVPAINYLIPVPDSTNPFYIIYGNQHLRLAERNAVNFNFFKFYLNKFLSLNFYLRGSITKNDVTLSRFIDVSGVQKVIPINVDRTRQFTVGASMNKNYKTSERFTFTLGFNPYFRYNQVPVVINGLSGKSVTTEFGPKMLLGFNFHHVVEFKPSYGLTLNKTSYSNNEFPDLQVITQNLQADLSVYWPWKIIWQSNLFFRHNSEVAAGLPRQSVLWNLAAAVPIMKSNRGQLKFTVYDLLNQNNNLSRYTSENLIVDQQVNVLKRYGLITFTYNFQNVGGSKQVSERRRLFLF